MTTRLCLAMTVLFGWLAAGAHANDALPNLFGDQSMATSTGLTQMISWGGEVEHDNSYADVVACCAPRPLQLSIGQRTWFTEGETAFSISNPGAAGPVSELTWKNLGSAVVELNVQAVLRDRFVLSTDVGFGIISGGRMLDQDFAGNNREFTFSSTWGDVDDDALFYLDLDLGYRVLSSSDECGKPRRYLDLFVGWQYWRESYVCSGAGGITSDPNDFVRTGFTRFDGPAVIYENADDNVGISEKFQWNSLKLGVRGQLDISRRFALRGQLALVPYTNLGFVDTHHNRNDLEKPSGLADVDGGWGVMFDETLSYNIWRGLFVEVGYQIYYLNSGSGVLEYREIGNPSEIDFNGAETLRHGVVLDVRYDF